jgi:hypothetical protein
LFQQATKAQKGYFDSLRNDVLNSNEELAYLNLGYSEEVVNEFSSIPATAVCAFLPDNSTSIPKSLSESFVVLACRPKSYKSPKRIF